MPYAILYGSGTHWYTQPQSATFIPLSHTPTGGFVHLGIHSTWVCPTTRIVPYSYLCPRWVWFIVGALSTWVCPITKRLLQVGMDLHSTLVCIPYSYLYPILPWVGMVVLGVHNTWVCPTTNSVPYSYLYAILPQVGIIYDGRPLDVNSGGA